MMIFFDYDGTIVDISEKWYQLHLDVTKKYNLPNYQRDEYITLKKNGALEKEIMSKIVKNDYVIDLYVNDRIKIIEQKKYLKLHKLFKNIDKVLEQWKKKGDLVLISNRRIVDNLLWELDNLKLRKYFKQILTIGADNKSLILNEHFTKETLTNSVMISDSYNDYLIAKDLKMLSIIVAYGCRSVEYFQNLGLSNLIYSTNDLLNVKKILDQRW